MGALVRSLVPVRQKHAAQYGTEPARVPKREALSAVRKAAQALGLDATDRQMIDAFAALTPAEDWDKGRPFVVATNRTLMQKAGIGSERSVSRRLRRLEQLGLITRRMSGNGQRRIRRSLDDKIIDAFGIDLSILQRRRDEFEQLTKAHDEAMRRLKAEAEAITALRCETQEATDALREVGAYDLAGNIEAALASLFPDHLRRSRGIERLSPEARAALAGETERLFAEALAVFDQAAACGKPTAMAEDMSSADDSVDQHLHRPAPITESSNQRRCADAQQTPSLASDVASGDAAPTRERAPGRPEEDFAKVARQAASGNHKRGSDRVMRPIELPVFKTACARFMEAFSYLPLSDWNDLFGVAEIARRQLKVDDQLWGRTCQALGHRRDLIASLVAYVFEKRYSEDPSFALDLPNRVGGYFRRCVESAEKKQLHLDISIYAMAARRRREESASALR